MILSNPEMKHKIISLKLSNEGIRGQIQEFLSLFPLNEFINLRSLSLINLKDKNIEQLLPMLPLLSNLYHFSFTDLKYRTSEILSALSKSKLRILSIPEFQYGIAVFKKMLITSLTISYCRSHELCELFKYASMLKYLKIEDLSDYIQQYDLAKFPIEKAVYLKQLIVDYCMDDFEIVEQLLKRIPNLTIFTICAPDKIDMIDANRWQHLIESSLPHLRVFNFYFGFRFSHYYPKDILNELQQFQTNFWCEQHHWHTNYEITYDSASIYTIPYVWKQYTLVPTMNRYSYSNEFDNVTMLILSRKAIKDNSPYYFKNVKSLILRYEYDGGSIQDFYNLQTTQIKYLNKIVNLSNIKHLELTSACKTLLSPSSLLELLKELPYVSSLKCDSLKSFYNNHELCECLNRKIKTLHFSCLFNGLYINSDEVDLLCKTFSNVEQLRTYIDKLDDLLSILRQCSKLSIINLTHINKHIYSWIEMNASKLNVYINFSSIISRDKEFLIVTSID